MNCASFLAIFFDFFSEVEDFGGFADGFGKGLDFVGGVVGGESDADGAFDAEGLHEGLGAVVTGADFNGLFVEEHADVVVVGSVEVEGYDGCFAGCGAVDGEARDFGEESGGLVEEVVFVDGDVLEADVLDVVEGGGYGADVDEVGCAGFEFVG